MVQAIHGSKVQVLVGWSARTSVLPRRDVQRISSLPVAEAPPARLGVSPWNFSETDLSAALPRQRDIGAAWWLLAEQHEDDLSLADWCELVLGDREPLHLAAGWLWLQGPQLWFRLRQQGISARPGDDLRRLRQQRRQGWLQQRQQQHWHGLLGQRQPIDAEALGPRQREELELLRRWAGEETDTPLPAELRRALASAHCTADSGGIRHLLVDLGQWSRHHLPSLSRTCWELGFSADLENEAERLAALAEGELPGDETRVDLCSQQGVTIDDDDTLDVDDGLALERGADGRPRLWIHVADPGRLVPPGSPLDLEARRRGTSLYLARGTLPMFPPLLSHGPFSLRAGRRCPAWSLWVELDEDGAVAASGICRSWIKPRYRLSYADADELIELAPPQERQLSELHALLGRRRRWRVAQGALLLDQPEGRIRDQDGAPQLEITEPGPSRQMVAEAMILAGAVVAEHGREHDLALPYRSQPPAELPPTHELEALPPGPVRHAAIKRCLSRGHTGSRPAPHFSLGLAAYVQATSPIRRYGDLLVQRQLEAQLQGGMPLDADALLGVIGELEGPTRQAMQISREDQRHWQQVWFEAHPGQQWRCCFLRWLRPQDRLGLVHVEDLAMDLPALCPEHCEPATSLLLRVQQVDPLRDQLRLVAGG
ncbi:MAG: RNB domain-containing ribonuclease [Cyanobium sp. Prado107]|nr:RNB domain-containing ribonuclease [Cyanobium sp. Prado107]